MGNQLNKIPASNTIISGLCTPPPGMVEAIFSEPDGNGGEREFTALVLALFIRQDVTEHGVTISLDGFINGGGVENLFPVGDLDNFRGFRYTKAAEGCKSGDAMECRECGTRFEVGKTSGICSRCAAGNTLFAAIQDAKEAGI